MHRPTFQFGLKSVFAVTTLAALILGVFVKGLDPPLDRMADLIFGAAIILGLPVALFGLADMIEALVIHAKRRFG